MSSATLTEETASTRVAHSRTEAAQGRTTLLDVATVGSACLLFLLLALYQLDLPGLYNDEAFDVIPAMQIVKGLDVELLRGAGVNLFGINFPLMSSSDYQGVTSTYLAIPFFLVGGPNVISLRLMTVLVGVVGIVLTYFLARSWFGPAEGRLAALLLATSPAWIFWSRLGVYVVSEVVPIAAGALVAFTVWVRRRPLGTRNRPLYVGMALLGLGLATKLLFLWFIAAVTLCALILWGRGVWEHRRAWLGQWRLGLRVGVLSAVAFCVGAFPFLLYNLQSRGTFDLIRYTLSNSGGATTHGVDNTAFVRNLWTEADAFKVLLDGGYFWFQGWLGATYSNPLTPALFALSAVGLVALALSVRHKGGEVTERAGYALKVGLGLTALGLLSSTMVAIGWFGAPLASIMAGTAGIIVIIFAALRRQGNMAGAMWGLLGISTVSGAVWWFGGSGRPPGPAEGAPLGLWPIDAAGALFWVSGAALVLLMGFDRNPAPRQRAVAATLALIGLIVAQSTVTISGLWSTHILVLLPLPQIAIAAFAVALGRRVGEWLAERRGGVRAHARLARALPALLIVGAIAACDLAVDYSYHRDLARTGGATTFSDSIYKLSDYLEGSGQKVVAMDWGFRRPLQFLTHERVDPIEAYGMEEEPSPQFYKSLEEFLADPNTLYIFHDRRSTAYHRHDAFMSEARKAGKTVTLERIFYQRDGVPVYEIYSAR